MSYKVNDLLANPTLDTLGDALAGGFLHMFAGPVPATPDAALDLVSDHTHLVTISVDGDGVTGLTFEAAAAGVLAKAAAETWTGTATFDGADDGEAALDAAFFRFCPSGDNGRGAGAGPRLQGTIGVTGSGADMERTSVEVPAGGSVPVSAFNVRVGTIL